MLLANAVDFYWLPNRLSIRIFFKKISDNLNLKNRLEIGFTVKESIRKKEIRKFVGKSMKNWFKKTTKNFWSHWLKIDFSSIFTHKK